MAGAGDDLPPGRRAHAGGRHRRIGRGEAQLPAARDRRADRCRHCGTLKPPYRARGPGAVGLRRRQHLLLACDLRVNRHRADRHHRAVRRAGACRISGVASGPRRLRAAGADGIPRFAVLAQFRLLDHDPSILTDYTARSLMVPPMAFIVGWAVALVAVAAWAVKAGRRWVVNLAAVFGTIHFYTQWFERLGATPGSGLIGGVLVVCLAVAGWEAN